LKCAACAFDNPDASTFCGGCGRLLANACPACGFKNPTHVDFCGGCGAVLAPPLDELHTRPPSTAPQLRQAERRRVTVLFADLVGSTSIAGQLDPEDLRGLIRTYLTACASVVHQFGGRVAQYLGDGILANFGYPMAHEDDAERAVRAGLGLVEAVRELRPVAVGAANIQLAVRVGIATGLVIAGDSPGGRPGEEDGLVGETLNLAARLQAAAEPN
jgi:class 3 adenylate cyclase